MPAWRRRSSRFSNPVACSNGSAMTAGKKKKKGTHYIIDYSKCTHLKISPILWNNTIQLKMILYWKIVSNRMCGFLKKINHMIGWERNGDKQWNWER